MRTLLAFLIAPLVPVTLLCLFGLADRIFHNEQQMLSPLAQLKLWFSYGAIIGYAAIFTIGVPSYLLLRRTRFNNLVFIICLSTAVGGVIGYALSDKDGITEPVMACAALAAIGGLSFWYIDRGF